MDPISDSSVSSSTWSFSERLVGRVYDGSNSAGSYGRRGDSSSSSSRSSGSKGISTKGGDNDNVVSSTTSSPSSSTASRSSFYLSSDSNILRNALLDKNRKSYCKF
eukprot:TRINITY_DN892_c0_g1_i10.p1 TRINITY_DN892_c0_g1~~TRINITY_DN892_c0_g1_i10.p1  ORF type:complete len:106 (+),score=24.93 TRINITY_DN892_c0_g1_i10:185-502(+)